MAVPKYHLLYFKSLLDVAFIEFFDEFNDCFVKNENDQYVLAKAVDEGAIEKFFIQSIERTLQTIVTPYDIIKSPDMYFIIGACNPRDNFLLNFRDGKYFPKKLEDIIMNSKFQLKYMLREKDIIIDIVKFNQACIDVFNHFFTQDRSKAKQNNVIFITHRHLDCYSMFKALKYILGNSNCRNLQQEKFSDIQSPIVAINDLIDLNIHNKQNANRDSRFKSMIHELKQFIMLNLNITS